MRTIDALMQCSLLMNAELSIGSVLKRIMDEAKQLLGAEAASVFLIDIAQQELSTLDAHNIKILTEEENPPEKIHPNY